MGRLTTHVLDTGSGKPAANLLLRLFQIADERILICETRTNRDGRTDQPLLEGAPFKAGVYELCFFVDGYFAQTDLPVSDPPFLDVITLRFTVANPAEQYHVPLLVSPWSYATYRGS